MKEATLTHFINENNEVLLGWQIEKVIGRKGPGGKIEPWQKTPEDNVVDEVRDETGGGIRFDTKDLIKVAVLDFYNGTEEEVPFGSPSFRVHIYICRAYHGEAVDTPEMQDWRYYPVTKLPFDEMPVGDELFMGRILRDGEYLTGWSRRDSAFKYIIDHDIQPCNPADLHTA